MASLLGQSERPLLSCPQVGLVITYVRGLAPRGSNVTLFNFLEITGDVRTVGNEFEIRGLLATGDSMLSSVARSGSLETELSIADRIFTNPISCLTLPVTGLHSDLLMVISPSVLVLGLFILLLRKRIGISATSRDF